MVYNKIPLEAQIGIRLLTLHINKDHKQIYIFYILARVANNIISRKERQFCSGYPF